MRLPHDTEAERALLGALLIRPEGWPEVVGLVEADDFYSAELAVVFDAIATVAPADSIAVTAEMRRRGADVRILADLIDDVPMPRHARRYARAVVRASQQRRLARLLSDMQQRALADAADPAAIAAEVEASVRDIGHREQEAVTIGEVLDGLLEDMDRGTYTSAQIDLGLRSLDEMLDGGLWGGRLYVIGARPGVGKTALACNVARRTCNSGKRVLFVSIEMSDREIVVRMMADQASRTAAEVRQPAVFTSLVEKAYTWPLEIVDKASKVAEIATKARATKPDLVIVDYLQLLTPAVRRDNRATEVAECSGDLKRLARELEVPIIACAQLNREVEGRGDQKPRLSDLRESGAIENDADVVLLLHRQKDKSPYDAKAIVAKNRHGADGEVSLAFKPRFARFEEAS